MKEPNQSKNQKAKENKEVKAPEASEAPAPVRFHWLYVVRLYYQGGGIKGLQTRDVNILVTSEEDYHPQSRLALVQRNAQIQARQHNKIPAQAEVVDAIITGVSFLGLMTDTQFQDFRVEQVAEASEADDKAPANQP